MSPTLVRLWFRFLWYGLGLLASIGLALGVLCPYLVTVGFQRTLVSAQPLWYSHFAFGALAAWGILRRNRDALAVGAALGTLGTLLGALLTLGMIRSLSTFGLRGRPDWGHLILGSSAAVLGLLAIHCKRVVRGCTLPQMSKADSGISGAPAA